MNKRTAVVLKEERKSIEVLQRRHDLWVIFKLDGTNGDHWTIGGARVSLAVAELERDPRWTVQRQETKPSVTYRVWLNA